RQREQALTAARAENASFRDVYDALQAQQQSTSKSLAEQQKQQAALDGSMSKLLSQLKARHANKAQAQQQIADLEKLGLRVKRKFLQRPQGAFSDCGPFPCNASLSTPRPILPSC
ncbi:putative Lipoprotein, partial [Pseudomonas syringae pv. maculicola]